MSKPRAKTARDPIFISQSTWMYAERGALTIIHEIKRPDGTHRSTEHINIPWKLIGHAMNLRAKEKKPKP